MKSAALLARSNSPSALLAEALTAIFPGDAIFEVFLLELFIALTKEFPRWKRTLGLPWCQRAWRGCRILLAGYAVSGYAPLCRRFGYLCCYSWRSRIA